MRVRVMIFLAAFSVATIQLAYADVPQMKDFAAEGSERAFVKGVDLSSDPEARRFRTNLRKAFSRGPEFSGHYAFAQWGCGTNCMASAVIDLTSGKVTCGPGSETGYEYNVESRLLVANPEAEAKRWISEYNACELGNTWATTSHYFEWDGSTFRHIKDVSWCRNDGGTK